MEKSEMENGLELLEKYSGHAIFGQVFMADRHETIAELHIRKCPIFCLPTYNLDDDVFFDNSYSTIQLNIPILPNVRRKRRSRRNCVAYFCLL